MAKWVKAVEVADLEVGKIYFLARRPIPPFGEYLFWSSDMNGKLCWTSKPGIALRYDPKESFRNVLLKNPDCVAVEVPADADKRWRARMIRRK